MLVVAVVEILRGLCVVDGVTTVVLQVAQLRLDVVQLGNEVLGPVGLTLRLLLQHPHLGQG